LGLAKACYNVFDRFVCRKFPLCAMIKEQMMDSGASCAMVSGSGPTIFGICEDSAAARKVEVDLRGFFGDAVWTCVLD
jgi:4-diphosphocytidyl-2-C-methyl-D-erythritol kinase